MNLKSKINFKRVEGKLCYNYVCITHKYASKRSGYCPTCKLPLICLGRSLWVGKKGNLSKMQNMIANSRIPDKILKELNKELKK